jgi:hypothetical protein
VQRLYSRSAEDSDLYHLQLDSTVLPLEACVETIIGVYRAARQVV